MGSYSKITELLPALLDNITTLRIAAPEVVTYTALFDASTGRAACEEANARFADPLTQDCKDYKVVLAQCESKAGAVALGIEVDKGARQYWVISQGLRIAVSAADEKKAQASCDQIATDLASRGLRAR